MPVPIKAWSESKISPNGTRKTKEKVWCERLREWQMVRIRTVTVTRYYVQDEVSQEESEHWTEWRRNEEGRWFHR